MKEKYLSFTVGDLAYYISGTGKPVVILHGWGQSFYSFKNISLELRQNYQVIGIDFLGFGLSDEPIKPLKIEDYTFQLRTLLEYLGVKNPTIIAHSFGGRVAIDFSKANNIDKLILVSSAGIKSFSFKKYYNIFKYKFLKFFYKIFSKKKYTYLINNSGSIDYKRASGVMKKTLSNVVNHSSKKDLKQIKAKTFLLWGINDLETKYSNAILMSKLIKNAKVIPFYESGHFCYIDEEAKFIRQVKLILEEN